MDCEEAEFVSSTAAQQEVDEKRPHPNRAPFLHHQALRRSTHSFPVNLFLERKNSAVCLFKCHQPRLSRPSPKHRASRSERVPKYESKRVLSSGALELGHRVIIPVSIHERPGRFHGALRPRGSIQRSGRLAGGRGTSSLRT